jgi:hypothetical protein
LGLFDAAFAALSALVLGQYRMRVMAIVCRVWLSSG